jgi:Tol biopolymer transport system component/Ca2+-binding RTX toxin-like protein
MSINEITLVSADAGGDQGNNYSDTPSISADGRYVAFTSYASDLVPGDTNGVPDVFVKDLQTGAITLASSDAWGNQGYGDSFQPSISADGRYVAFYSLADNLVPGDTNWTYDMFVKDLQTGAITRVSTDARSDQGNGDSSEPSISADGRYVAFTSFADNLVPGDTNGTLDVFVKDLLTGAITLANAGGDQGNSYSFQPSISADGRYVAFTKYTYSLVPGDTNGTFDVFVKDLQTGAITLASSDAGGDQGNSYSWEPSISADGRYVAFHSEASDLVPGDTNGVPDVFVKDLQTGAITLASSDAGGDQGNNQSDTASISADGRYVTFTSLADNLVPGDTNGVPDVFVKDLQTGAITLVSSDAGGDQGNSYSYTPSISADGRYVAFFSYASDLVTGDTNGVPDVFVTPIGFAVNVAPTADPVNASGSEDAASIAITLSGSDADAGDMVDSFKLSGLPANGTLYVDAALTQLAAVATAYAASANQLTLHFVPDANWNGQTDFQYTFNDGQLDSAAATATIDVTSVNDAPTLANAIADQTATPGQAYPFALPANTFADVDVGDTLILSTSALPSWLAFNAATGTFAGTPGSGNVGVTNVTVTATDLAGAAVSDTFSLTVSSAGSDSITGTTGDDVINAQGGNDTVNAGDGNDTVTGGTGIDSVNGGAGNDTFVATIGDGNDAYAGGTGIDTLDMSAITANATINLPNGRASSTQTGSDSLSSIENATGGSGNDQISGTSAANVLDGRAGNDTINAGSGNDIVIGGTGDDVMNGGSGTDTFVFAAGFGNDRINGFDANPSGGQDLLDIRALGITDATFDNDVTITDLGADTQVQIGTDSILLVGVNGIGANSITEQDFLLA